MELLIQFATNQRPVKVHIQDLEQLLHKLIIMRIYQKQYSKGMQDVSKKLAYQYEIDVDRCLTAIMDGKQSVLGF